MSAGDTTRERLLEAAIVEFAEHGFDHATVRDICARAGANLNGVNYHFQDKQGLYVAAVRHAHAATKPSDRPLPPTDATPAERLESFITELLTMAMSAESESAQLLVMREMINPTQATEEIVRSFIKPRFAQLDAILSEMLPPETPNIDRHLLALSVVGQCFHYKIGRHIDRMLIAPSEYRRFTLPRLATHILEVIEASIQAKWQKLS